MRQSAQERIQTIGAITTGHFVYAAGGHGDIYVDKNKLFTRPDLLTLMGQALSEECIRHLATTTQLKQVPQVVLGPAMGGAILSPWLGFHLRQYIRTNLPIHSAFAEKTADGSFVFNRGYQSLVSGNDVLVAEDVITTGQSVKKVIDAVRALGGTVLGVATIVNRSMSKVTAEALGVPFLATLYDLDLNNWTEDECPFCKDGVPVNTEIGHGKQFVDRQRAKAFIAMQIG